MEHTKNSQYQNTHSSFEETTLETPRPRPPHLEHWQNVADMRSEIGAIALANYQRVHQLRDGFMRNQITDEQIIELGLSFGADNDMEGGQYDLEAIFARLYQNNINEIDGMHYHSMARQSRQDVCGMMMRIPLERQVSSPKLFHAAQFLHESAELERSLPVNEAMLYGAVDIYEHICNDEDVSWKQAYKRQALLHKHAILSSLIARDLSREDLAERRAESEDYFKQLQIETVEQILECARISDEKEGTFRPLYSMRNGELFEMFTQVGGWYLIYEEGLFGEFDIQPAKERENRPRDDITGTKLRKYAHDAVVLRRDEDGVVERTRIQLKACPQEQDWESKYVRNVPVVRIRPISEDRLRKRLLKSLRQIKGQYRSPKPRSERQLQKAVRDIFDTEIFKEAA